jgi:hypothetical protein
MPLAAAATSVLLLARRSTSALACRGIRRLCPVRVERGEDPHVSLASTSSAATAASYGAEPQLLAG